MTDESELRGGVRPGSDRGATPLRPPSDPPQPLLAQPVVGDLIKVLVGGAIGFLAAVGWTRDGVQTGRRGFELGLENRAAVQANKLETEKIFHRVTTAFGKSINAAIAPLVDEQRKTSEAVAVLVNAQQSNQKRIERLEVELRDWQIREKVR